MATLSPSDIALIQGKNDLARNRVVAPVSNTIDRGDGITDTALTSRLTTPTNPPASAPVSTSKTVSPEEQSLGLTQAEKDAGVSIDIFGKKFPASRNEPAPLGSIRQANGTFVDSQGNIFTQPPVDTTKGATANPNDAFSLAIANLNPQSVGTEEDFFAKVQSQLAPVIDAINEADQAAEQAVFAAGTKEKTALAGEFGTRGLAGGSESAKLAGQVSLDIAQGIAQAKQARASALSSVSQFVTSEAFKQFTDARDNNIRLSQDFVNAIQSTAAQTIKGLAEAGITSGDEIQQQNPQAYFNLLQAFRGDTAALDAALALSQPTGNILQSWTSGTTYFQLIQDKITGKPRVQSVDVGITIPPNYTSAKIGTNSIIFQDSNNPANTIIYTNDPLTGQVSVQGTGVNANISSPTSATTETTPSDTTTQPTTTPATGTASTTVASILGVDKTQTLSNVIASVGLGSIVSALIKNEGGSPAGVVNNPGNIKFDNLPGQIDSKVKATDGGTFASYKTPEEGQKAIEDIVNTAASGTSSVYGTNPTLESFVNTYTNQTEKASSTATSQTSQTGTTGTNGLPIAQYGALANVSGFNPNASGRTGIIDKGAFNYLMDYFSGKFDKPSDVGISLRTGAGAVFNDIKARAKDIFFKATGKNLPSLAVLQGNIKLINTNNSLINKLAVQTATVESNFGLSLQNLNANNINSSIPFINRLYDAYKAGIGDPNVAQFFAQNRTLQNELASLLSVKSAAGRTVQDALDSKTLSPSEFTPKQLTSILDILTKEAQNANTAAIIANAKLYEQTDPLGLDPQNILNSTINLRNLNDPTQGVKIDKGQVNSSDLEDALNQGWVIVSQ